MDLSKVEVVVSNDTHRLFRVVKPGIRVDQEIIWGEYKGQAIIVWCKFLSKIKGKVSPAKKSGMPPRRRLRVIGPRMRDQARNFGTYVALKKGLENASQEIRDMGFNKLVRVKKTPSETVWHVVKPDTEHEH
jgi:hypothetical protein